MAVVTFTTDFGTRDAYVAAMKGVVLSLAANALPIDVTHAIPAQDIRAGAWALADAAPLFPPGTIHVAVVDPGVGGERDGIVVASGNQFFVGPDNGVLSLAAGEPRRIFRIDSPSFRREPVSPTFHGRDIFAVTAGRLAAGRAIDEAGMQLSTMAFLAWPDAQPLSDDCTGEVIRVDHFGNLVTSFTGGLTDGRWDLRCDDRRFEVAGGRTFSDVEGGAFVLYAGSSDRIEIAVRDGSAALLTQCKSGTKLRLKRLS
jgi:S-adenosyl-L-methionine hydrolase (adenosine-forming)